MVNVCGAEVSTPPLAVPPLSLRRMVIVAEPFAFVARVKLSAPEELMNGVPENRLGLVLLVTTKLSVWPDSSGGPAEMLVAQLEMNWKPESSLTVRSGPFVNDGASLTALTVTANVCAADVSTPPLAVPPLSMSETVMVAEPFAFAAGVYVKVPVELIAGAEENKPALVLAVTWKVSV